MIKNKCIWITGAGSGIGRSLALKLAAMGNHVLISGRNVEKLKSVVQDFNKMSESISTDSDGSIISNSAAKISILPYNVSDDSQVDYLKQKIRAIFDALDISIICAGHCEYVDNANLQADLFRRVFDVNVFGAVNTTAIALPMLRERALQAKKHEHHDSRPQIVAIASLSALVGFPRAEAYGASKAAMNYLFDSLRLDIACDDIDVTVVNPGFVETPMTQVNDFSMPFLMQADEAADRIIAAIAKRKRRLDFPRRLSWLLRLAAMLPAVWYNWVGPKLARQRESIRSSL